MEKQSMQRTPVQSSNIKSIGYKPIQRKLEVEFKSGDVYRYKSVPRATYKNLMSSQSKGKYLNNHIKYKHPYRKYKDRDGDFVKGNWQVLEKKTKQNLDKSAFDESFADYIEKLASKKNISEEEAKSTLDALKIDLEKEKWTLLDFVNGMNVELEHGTRDPETNVSNDSLITTGKIALAHLNEFPDYYNSLDKMESDLKKKSFDELFTNLLEKRAALNSDVELYPHQKRVVESPETSKVIAHSVGGGKTLTGIAKFEKMKENGQARKALVVVPASLRDNFGESGVGKFTDSKYNIVGNKQEIKSGVYKALDPNADYNIISYEMYRKNPKEILRITGADTVITDEAHRGKNEGTLTTEQLRKNRSLYKNHISLTGSVVSNSVADVQPLVDLVSNGKANIGKNKNEFDQMYVKRSTSNKYKNVHEKRKPIVGFNNRKYLGNELSKYVDYADYDDLKDIADMPEKKVVLKKVVLSKEQAKAYKKMLNDDPRMMQLVKQKRLETLKDDEIASAFSKLIEERKLMNSVGTVTPGMSLSESWKSTPKTRRVIEDLDNYLKNTPDGQALVMSHLITGGTDIVEQGLKDKRIPYGTFTGKGNKGVTEASRQQAVRDFNDRKSRVMIVSPAGGEGLSLNDTTYEAVLDPHYNPEKMKQMEARGIRAGGLKGREDRTVEVNRYIATMPRTLGIFKSSIKTPDEVIYNIQENKDQQNQKLYDLMKQYR